MKKVFLLYHVPSEKAGTIRDFLKKRKIPFREIHLYNGERLPGVRNVRAAVVMGGPMNVDEVKKYPFLKTEVIFLKKLLKAGVPCLGVCLGAQLLAKALGSKVYKASKKEIGWQNVRLSRAAKSDALFSVVKAPHLQVLQWHEDTFDLPENTVRLASSAAVPNQAFRFGRSYGLQFHVEVKKDMLERWFKKRKDLRKILKIHEAYGPKLNRLTDGFYDRFFSFSQRT